MRTERFDFPNSKGEKLAALLDRPLGKPVAYALFAHCFTCGKDNLAAKRIAERLTESGIAVMRFDFTGLGMSEGEFANTHFSSNVEDLIAAANHLRATYGAPANPDRPQPRRRSCARRRAEGAGCARRGHHLRPGRSRPRRRSFQGQGGGNPRTGRGRGVSSPGGRSASSANSSTMSPRSGCRKVSPRCARRC